ncbi:MAG TPA: hypothetical protein VET23_15975, partial [Chitinophagaceae bacterium]|nr:hypothetical protein [Chitinophagaceae bacterium]
RLRSLFKLVRSMFSYSDKKLNHQLLTNDHRVSIPALFKKISFRQRNVPISQSNEYILRMRLKKNFSFFTISSPLQTGLSTYKFLNQ